jgi:hypothetical protein
MLEKLPNIVIDNVLSDNDRNTLIDIYNQTTNMHFNEEQGYLTRHIRIPPEIEQRFTQVAEEAVKMKLFIAEYNMSRYQITQSDCGKTFYPVLFPHTDETFKEERVTFDYQIRSNVDWGISVDDHNEANTYVLKDNQALTFSGTHQIHWRPKKQFNQNDFVEMIFIHFKTENGEQLTKDHTNKMKSRGKNIFDQWNLEEGVSYNKGFENTVIHRYNPVGDK